MPTRFTIAQTEVLLALDRLGAGYHSAEAIVKSRIKTRQGDHQTHFEKHWELMITKTAGKLSELKDQKLVRIGKVVRGTQPGWALTSKGAKAAKELT